MGLLYGAAMVLFVKNNISTRIEKFLLGFASGVMVAASVWSLLIPSIEMVEVNYKIPWIPAAVGFFVGIIFLSLLDSEMWGRRFNFDISKLSKHFGKSSSIGIKLKKTIMTVFAVTLHNIPEGMAVGVIFAGAISGNSGITMAGAYALAIGIAIQNFPEGAIISMPLRAEGMSRAKAFLFGALSGLVEPIGAIITIALTGTISCILPYFLSFAAGAMIYVVVKELIPESQQGDFSSIATIGVAVGFVIMMVMDVALG